MIFEKANEYLFEIFSSNEERDKDFGLFITGKNSTVIGGNLNTSGEAYLLNQTPNQIGLKIDDSKYLFIQRRTKFINENGFKPIIENDEVFSANKFRETFKNVDYVEFFESDKEKGETIKLSYLVNKSSYLLIGYKRNSGTNRNVSASINGNILCGKSLQKLGLDCPDDDNFDVSKRLQSIEVLVPSSQHFIFEMKSDGKELENIELRARFLKTLYTYIVEADKNSYMIRSDSDDCIETTRNSILKNYGNNSNEGR